MSVANLVMRIRRAIRPGHAPVDTPNTSARFVLVRLVSPYTQHEGFMRAGLRFTREWRVLELGEADNLELAIVGPATLARLRGESFLVVRDATAEEIIERTIR